MEESLTRLREEKIHESASTNYKYYCSICLLIRDENEYLKEWLEWHISQGVQHFYIYDNGSKHSVYDFLLPLGLLHSKVTVLDFSGQHEHLQHEAYGDCLKRFGKSSRWIGFIDSDEMVRVKEEKKLPEFLKEFEDYAGLFIPWIIYDANGQLKKSDLPCRERFTKIASSDLWPGMGKVFVQPLYMRQMLVHNGYPIEGFEIADENKNPVEAAVIMVPSATCERICVDHYYTKSHQEWIEKIWRGSCNPNYLRKYDEFFHFNPELAEFFQQGIPVQGYEESAKLDEDLKQKLLLPKNFIKVLLKLDGLTNKVIAHKEYWGIDAGVSFEEKDKHTRAVMQYDVTVDVESPRFFSDAERAGQDVFYEGGRLIKKAKDPNEHHNITANISREIEELKVEERTAFVAYTQSRQNPEFESRLKQIKETREEKIRSLARLSEDYKSKIWEEKTAEIIQTDFKYYCSICLIIRDENEYLKEWLEWHIGQGVQHFYIYDHGSLEPVVDFVQALGNEIADKVTVVDHSGKHNHAQFEAYNDCLKQFGKESRWIGFVDADEMVRVKDERQLPDFLKDFEDYAGLFMLWVVYDANGHLKKSDLPCRERFTRATSINATPGMGKSFVQATYMRHMMIHSGYTFEGCTVVDENKNPIEQAVTMAPEATDNLICVDHYYTKSHEEWMEKILRGSCDANYSRRYDEFFHFNPDLRDFRAKQIPVQDYEVSKKHYEKRKQAKLKEMKQTEHKYYCSLCLIIRDENEYLEEWLKWHIGQGVEHFYIYDHDSTKPVAEFIQSMGAQTSEQITIVDWSGKHDNAQPNAYNDCLKRFGKESKWIGFIDADEHVRVKTGMLLPTFLKSYEDFAGLFAVWTMYGANGQKYKSDLPLRQRFPKPVSVKTWSDKMGKVFVQSLLMKDIYIHNGHPEDGFNVVGEAKDVVSENQFWKENAKTSLICVDHYHTKSYEEWIEKLKRGTGHSQYRREYKEFFEYNPDMENCREEIYPIQRYETSTKET